MDHKKQFYYKGTNTDMTKAYLEQVNSVSTENVGLGSLGSAGQKESKEPSCTSCPWLCLHWPECCLKRWRGSSYQKRGNLYVSAFHLENNNGQH